MTDELPSGSDSRDVQLQLACRRVHVGCRRLLPPHEALRLLLRILKPSRGVSMAVDTSAVQFWVQVIGVCAEPIHVLACPQIMPVACN